MLGSPLKQREQRQVCTQVIEHLSVETLACPVPSCEYQDHKVEFCALKATEDSNNALTEYYGASYLQHPGVSRQ